MLGLEVLSTACLYESLLRTKLFHYLLSLPCSLGVSIISVTQYHVWCMNNKHDRIRLARGFSFGFKALLEMDVIPISTIDLT